MEQVPAANACALFVIIVQMEPVFEVKVTTKELVAEYVRVWSEFPTVIELGAVNETVCDALLTVNVNV